MITAILLGVGLGCLIFLLLYTAAYVSFYGCRCTTTIPGGLEAELAKGAEGTVLCMFDPQCLFVMRSEHYDWITLTPLFVRVRLIGGKRNIHVPRGTKAYETLREYVENGPTTEEFLGSIGARDLRERYDEDSLDDEGEEWKTRST